MKPVVVINVVGLTWEMIGNRCPNIASVRDAGFGSPMNPVLPAVTCSAQATMLTGTPVRSHGIVGNGWYDRDYAEVVFWKQSNHLIGGEKVYDTARRINPAHRTAKLFWWFNMYADVACSVTPRPSYPADGRKVFDSYSSPADLKDRLQSELGVFPLHRFWGPTANIESSRWIASASRSVLRDERPDLTLIYLPHLDYDLQRFGPSGPHLDRCLEDIDAEVGRILESARDRDAEVIILSEYALLPVETPIAINRQLRADGLLTVRNEITGWETLDAGASRAFAVADHQIAHVYVTNPNDLSRVRESIRQLDGVERVLDRNDQAEFGLDHPRAGDLVAVAAPGFWFSYYFWTDDAVAPDYARTVDIHRKPGYDPAELFTDPKLKIPALRIARRLLRKKLGFRYYMDVIPTHADMVRGSHGRLPQPGREESEAPVFLCSSNSIERDAVAMTDVKRLLLELQFGASALETLSP